MCGQLPLLQSLNPSPFLKGEKMRFTKMLGTCVIAALATMAMVSAGSASATTLCKTSEDPCGAANRYPSGTKIGMELASGSKFILTAGGSAVLECSKSTLEAKTTAASGGPLPLQVTGLTFGLCFSECTSFSPVALPWEASMAGTGGGKATLKVNKLTIKLSNCSILKIACTYGAENVEAPMSGNPLQTAFENEPLGLTEGSMFCPKEGTMSATYSATSPSPLFVSQAP